MRIRINNHIPIETARKDCQVDGTPYDIDDPDQASEWAVAVAMQKFKIGEAVDEEVLADEIEIAVMTQTLSKMIDNGDIEMTWDSVLGEPVYRATQQGLEKGKKLLEGEL